MDNMRVYLDLSPCTTHYLSFLLFSWKWFPEPLHIPALLTERLTNRIEGKC
jgi:hypothetical protein